MKTAIILIILFNAFIFVFMYRLRSPKRNSLAPAKKVGERLLERLHTSTKLERLLFVCCVYVGIWEVIFKIIGA